MRSNGDVEQAIDVYGNSVWRACVLYFGPGADAQDAFQETFCKYAFNEVLFTGEEHRKAWLIRVATNVCKDMLKAAHRKTVSIDDDAAPIALGKLGADESSDGTFAEVLAAMQGLTDPPRTPVYLALYEGYTAPEISAMLDAPVNTVYSWIARGKKQLREVLK